MFFFLFTNFVKYYKILYFYKIKKLLKISIYVTDINYMFNIIYSFIQIEKPCKKYLFHTFIFFYLQDSGAGSSLDEDEPIKTNRR